MVLTNAQSNALVGWECIREGAAHGPHVLAYCRVARLMGSSTLCVYTIEGQGYWRAGKGDVVAAISDQVRFHCHQGL